MKELLEELATEARTYDGTERAVRVMRRGRRLVRLTPFAVATVVVVAVTLTYVSVARPDDDGGPAPTTTVSWLPSQLTATIEPPSPMLPDGEAVGPAALIYLPRNNGPHVLVTTTGDRYRLNGGGQNALSPNGRWLVSRSGPELAVRDLLGTTELAVAEDTHASFQADWSSDSDRLVLSQGAGAVTVVDLPMGTAHALTIGADRYVCGVQDAGDLLLCSQVRVAGEDPTLWRVDAVTGATKATVTLRIAGALTTEERTAQGVDPAAGTLVVAAAGGHTVLVRTARLDPAYSVAVPGDLLELDVTSGRLVTRLALPQERTGPMRPKDGAVSFGMAETRSFAAALPDVGILLVHSGPLGVDADAFVQAVYSVEVLDPITGDRAVAMTVTGAARGLVLRGQSRPPPSPGPASG